MQDAIAALRFARRIEAMNRMYRLPIEKRPTIGADAEERLTNFHKTIGDEIDEGADILTEFLVPETRSDLDHLVSIADWLADIDRIQPRR